MNNSEPAARPESEAAPHAGAEHAEHAGAEAAEPAGAEPTEPIEPEHVVVVSEQPVELQRSVRYGRVLIGAAIIGAAVLSLLSLMIPLGPESEYSMPQIVGFMALIGAAIGLGVGAVLSLVLTVVAKRKHGSGVAIQTDVR